MHVEFLVEEASAKAALECVLPGILPDGVDWEVLAFRCKSDLLRELPRRLRGYAHWLPTDWFLCVLVDADQANCQDLKAGLERMSRDARLVSKSARRLQQRAQVLNRIAVEELEAWFFGDVEAICRAYPGVPTTLGSRAPFRNPDAITGGTWEALERVLQRAGHHRGGLAKIEAARAIATHMDPTRNRSRSFRHFRDGLRFLVRQGRA